MKENEDMRGLVRVGSIGERGFVIETYVYSGVITREGSVLVRKTEEESSVWYILVGTQDRIRYRGKEELGRVRVLDQEYPKVVEDDRGTVILYRATFVADELNAREVNSAMLVNRHHQQLQNIAYARIDPTLRIQTGGMLQVQWEMTVRSGKAVMSFDRAELSTGR